MPCEAMTGTTPVAITDSLVLPAPTNLTLNMSNIREAAAAYALIARKHGDYMRKQRTEVLNSHGRLLQPLLVGHYVKKDTTP